jgi:kumamolisin
MPVVSFCAFWEIRKEIMMVENQQSEKTDKSVSPETSSARESLINDVLKTQVAATSDLLGPPPAPGSAFKRHGMVTAQGIWNLPVGVINSAYHQVTHPMETLEIAGAAAAMGAGLKLILPEAGPAGKIAGAAIGIYFTYQAAKPMMEAYSQAHNATTLPQLNDAGWKLGNAGGEFIVHTGIAMAGYKVGAGATEHVLLSERFDKFADWKQGKWDSVTNTFKSAYDTALGRNKAPLDTTNVQPRNGTSRYWPSDKKLPEGAQPKGEINPASEMEATVMLKSKGTDLAMDRTLKRIHAGRQGFLTDQQLTEKFGPSEKAVTEITKFANDHGLKMTADPRSGRVVLTGEAGKFQHAFQIPLKEYATPDGTTFRGRQGALAIPDTLHRHIEGVYGLDNRPHARSYARFLPMPDQPAAAEAAKPSKLVEPRDGGKGSKPAADAPKGDAPKGGDGAKPPEAGPAEPRARTGYLSTEIADAYKFPKQGMGENTSVSIIQLGGGMDPINEAAYYKQHGLPHPEIKLISVSGAPTTPSGIPRYDGEVALDSQIIGGIAPKAQQKIIFAPNTDAGFIDAVTRGTFHQAGERPTTAISISWGQAEEAWTPQAMQGLSTAFKKAAMKGISIFAAAGDDGAVDNAPSGRFNTDYPASDPNVTASGGTRLLIERGQISSEMAWNSSGGATGGGISQKFPRPDFQKDLAIPKNPQNPNFLGRGVPDISGNADPATGWKIKVNGVDQLSGGTSAVAPMFAGLSLRIASILGQNTGPWNPFLYRQGMGGGAIYNDIIMGHNNGYSTAFGWDPVTGWGSVNGTAMLDAIRLGGINPTTRVPLIPMPIDANLTKNKNP